MNAETAVFAAIAAAMVLGGLGTVLARNVLHAALSLVFCFFGTAVLYLSLHAEFNALAQVMVYVGGVLVFVVFAILMTSGLGERHLRSGKARVAVAALLAGSFLALVRRAVSRSAGALALREPANDGFSTLEGLGRTLLSPDEGGALVPFELMTALLLAALVGAVVVARRTEEDR